MTDVAEIHLNQSIIEPEILDILKVFFYIFIVKKSHEKATKKSRV